MRLRPRVPFALTILATIALAFSACGGDRPAERAAAPAVPTPVPEAAPAQPAAPPPEDRAAPAVPPAAEPASAQPVAKPAQRHKANPAPPPRPEPVVRIVTPWTDLEVELLDGASSGTSQVGDLVRARVTKAVVIDGLTVIPTGAIINGTVTEAIPLKKIGGAASLGLRFDTLELGGGARTAIAAGLREKGKSESGKDAGTIAGATAGGALLGRLLSKNDKTKGTLIGAAVGAAAGTGVAAATKGKEVELPVGTALALHLEEPLEITLQP